MEEFNVDKLLIQPKKLGKTLLEILLAANENNVINFYTRVSNLI